MNTSNFDSNTKIFNIGFHKTGTTSLTSFMQKNGYRVLHNVQSTMEYLGIGIQGEGGEGDGTITDILALIDPNALGDLVAKYDFFSDNPWPLLYRYLDVRYPHSRFILSLRDVNTWIRSLVDNFGSDNTLMRQYIYGYGNPANHTEHYKAIYHRHNEEVLSYFSGKENLLVYCIEEDDQVISNKINVFLGNELNNAAFPSKYPAR